MLAHELYLHDLKTVLYAPPVIIFLWGKKCTMTTTEIYCNSLDLKSTFSEIMHY